MRWMAVVLTWTMAAVCAGNRPCPAATLIERNAAARFGMVRSWYAQVGALRATGSIAHVNYDRGTLLVQSSRGMITALDAETGRTLWSTQAGPRDHMSTRPDANAQFVVVVSGSVLYVLDRSAGHVVWEKPLGGAPGAGPGVTDTHAFVPMVNGKIEGYELAKGAKQQPWIYKSAGRVESSPMCTPVSVSWTTDRGYFYVAGPSGEGTRYRLETRGAIHAPAAYWTPRLYACSTDGYVYAMDESSGKIEWKLPLGDAIYQSPVAIGPRVFVVSEFSGMFCLDGTSGSQLWFVPGIIQFVSQSNSRVYACDRIGRLVAIDLETGRQLGSMPLVGVPIKMINTQSDRVFLANDSCVVQCLRQVDLKVPVLHVPPKLEKTEVKLKPGVSKEDSSEPGADEPTEKPSMVDEPETPPAKDEMPAAPADDDADNPFK